MARSVASLRADVVALQEVDRRVFRSWFVDQAAAAGRAAGMHPHFAAARPFGPFGRYGNALLVRGRTVRTLRLRLPGVQEPRVALFARVIVRDQEVTVVGTHLQNRRGAQPSEAPGQLDAVLAELARWPEPWILMGDMNLRSGVVEPAVSAAGLVTHRADPTFPADAPRICLDWIASRGLGPARVVVPRLLTSDHRPVVAEFDPVLLMAERLPADRRN